MTNSLYHKTVITLHARFTVVTVLSGAALMHVIAYEDAVGGRSVLVDGFKLGGHMKQHFPEYFSLLSNVSIPYKLTFSLQTDIQRCRQLPHPSIHLFSG